MGLIEVVSVGDPSWDAANGLVDGERLLNPFVNIPLTFRYHGCDYDGEVHFYPNPPREFSSYGLRESVCRLASEVIRVLPKERMRIENPQVADHVVKQANLTGLQPITFIYCGHCGHKSTQYNSVFQNGSCVHCNKPELKRDVLCSLNSE